MLSSFVKINLEAFLGRVFLFLSMFVLFLFSYQYKHSIELFKEYDPTLYLGLILLIYLIYFVIRNFSTIRLDKYHAVFCLFTLWLLVSYFWGSSSTYAFAKSVRFLVYVVPSFLVATLIIAPSPQRLENFITVLLTFYAIISSITLLTYFENPENLPNLFGTNYLVTGQTIGLGAVILGAKLFHKNNNSLVDKSTWLIACGIIISVFLQVHIGGRGPLLNTLIVLGSLFVVFHKNKPQKLLKISSFAMLIIAVSIFLGKFQGHHHLPASLHRIFSEDGIQSLALRLEYYQSALQCLQTHSLIGVGIGSWPDYYGLEKLYEIEWHPHNIFLEIAAETGLVGLMLFIYLLVLLAKKVSKHLNSSELPVTILLSGIIFCFLNALKSGDINDNIVFFTFSGLMAGFKCKKEHADVLPLKLIN